MERVASPSILTCDAPSSHYAVEPAHFGLSVVRAAAPIRRHYVILTLRVCNCGTGPWRLTSVVGQYHQIVVNSCATGEFSTRNSYVTAAF